MKRKKVLAGVAAVAGFVALVAFAQVPNAPAQFAVEGGVSLGGGPPAPSGTRGDGNPANGEARCDELGSNCICAEAFNTNSYTGTTNKNPSDSTSRQCSATGSSGSAIVLTRANDFLPNNNSTALAALPSRHSVNYFFASPSTHTGDGAIWVGHDNLGATFTKRVAVRFYMYYDSNFQFRGDGSCTNCKLMQIGGQGGSGASMPIDQSTGRITQYGFNANGGHKYNNNTQTMGDCCVEGPPGASNTSKAALRGKWWRYEYVITNRAGGSSPNGIRYELWAKNVTDNSAEIKVIDTRAACPTCGPNPGGLGWDDVVPPSRIDSMVGNFYRQDTCLGIRGISHMMYAGWDTDTGQRIGSAYEIEGVAGSTG